MPAQTRAAMAADVVVALHRAGFVAEHDDAVAAAELEHEVVAGLRDPALVIDHEPEVFGHESLVGRIVLVVDVVLGRNRRALPPAANDHGGGITLAPAPARRPPARVPAKCCRGSSSPANSPP